MDDLLSELSDGTIAEFSLLTPAEPRYAQIARVVLDLKVSHLDQVMDYGIPIELEHAVQVGVRVKVPLAGSEVFGWVVEIEESSEHVNILRPISQVLSLLPVLSEEIYLIAQKLAKARVCTVAHVLRSAIPTRYAGVEKSFLAVQDQYFPVWKSPDSSELDVYPTGSVFLSHIAQGEGPRAIWNYLPNADNEDSLGPGHWRAIGASVQACLASGRSAIVVTPTAAIAEGVAQVLENLLPGEPISRLHQDLRPATRYRAHLDAISGHTRVVVGTRNAVYSPVQKLGLLVILDPLDNRLVAQRTPYTPAWEVAALRTLQNSAALLIAGLMIPAWGQRLLETSWAAVIVAERALVRERTPMIKVPDDYMLARDGSSAHSRLPSSAYQMIKRGLEKGPVLVHVERAGYTPAIACAGCFRSVHCSQCAGPVVGLRSGYSCTQCGAKLNKFSCPHCEGKTIKNVRVGAERTAEEFGRAFPKIPILVSSAATRVIDKVDSRPRLVVATRHATPSAEGGFSAAVILDPLVALNSPVADAAEQAVGTWFEVAAKVRSGGEVLLSGEVPAEYSQTLVRWSPSRFTKWQYEQYAQAQLSPAWWTATVLGSRSAVNRVHAAVEADHEIKFVQVYGPFPAVEELADEALRVLHEPNALVLHYCAPRSQAQAAARALKVARSVASANDDDKLLIRVH